MIAAAMQIMAAKPWSVLSLRVAMRTGFVDDPGEDNRLIVLRFHCTGEGRVLAIWHVVTQAFDICQRALFSPDFAVLAWRAERILHVGRVCPKANRGTTPIMPR